MENTSQHEEIFTVQLAPSIRNFKGQSSGTKGDVFTINAVSVEHFKACVIDAVLPLVCREIIFSTDLVPSWRSSMAPDREDIDRFVLFYPPSKRVVELNSIKSHVLQTWLYKCIPLFVHKYSNAVSSKALWVNVEKTLILPAQRDRAGATTTASLLALKERLKELHCESYQSQDINWQLWANYIQASDAHLQESLLTQAPPAHLIHLFAHAPMNPDIQLNNLRRGLGVAYNINQNFVNAITQLESTIDTLKRKHDEIEKVHQTAVSQLTALREMADVYSSMLNGVESAVGTTETEYGLSILHEIEDIQDDDHA
ncbi:hypothetical protein LEN26_011343 [Aphanomyces euteiches]|nr:hypothetical protein LEN26_011343 [Aphanomyces euteiches]